MKKTLYSALILGLSPFMWASILLLSIGLDWSYRTGLTVSAFAVPFTVWIHSRAAKLIIAGFFQKALNSETKNFGQK